MARPSFLSPLLARSSEAFVIRVRDTGRTLATQVETAFTSETRRKGLLGRDSLDRDAALIIAPCNAIHTFFMRFAIDVAFVDRSGRVLRMRRGLRSWRIAFAVRAFAVIELAAGALDRAAVSEGATIEVAPR